MLGYHKEPDLSKEAITADGFLKTGDRGEIDAQGRLRITGRVKELFKTSKGKYVAPAPIENLLNADSLVEMSCVSGSGQSQPYALIMLSENVRKRLQKEPAYQASVEAALGELLVRVNRESEEWEQLLFLVVVKQEWLIENGFLTPTMKLKRDVVEQVYGGEVEGWYAAKKPVLFQS
jgi:long-subunit acyl-CoA synthetase (AMP-forming)